MRPHYLQHVPFEGPDSVDPWLESKGHELTCTRFFESTDLPDFRTIDLLVIMGGPMSVQTSFTASAHIIIGDKLCKHHMLEARFFIKFRTSSVSFSALTESFL